MYTNSRFGHLFDLTDNRYGVDVRDVYPYWEESVTWWKIKSIFNQLTYGPVWSGNPTTARDCMSRMINLQTFEPLVSQNPVILPKFVEALSVTRHKHGSQIDTKEAYYLLHLAINESADKLDRAVFETKVTVNRTRELEEWHKQVRLSKRYDISRLMSCVNSVSNQFVKVLLHGSMADGQVVDGYSDCDLMCVVNLLSDPCNGELFDAAKFILSLNHNLLSINPCMHHGPTIIFDRELKWCAESYFPSIFLQKGVWLTEHVNEIAYRDSKLENILVFSIFESFFEQQITKASDIKNAFDAIWWSSSVLILPLLLRQMFENESTWKRDCLMSRGSYMDADHWRVIDQISVIRLNVGNFVKDKICHPCWDLNSNLNPGVCLSHHKNILKINAQQLKQLGIDDDIILTARCLWEFASFSALSYHADQVRQKTQEEISHIFLWPKSLCEPPRALGFQDYDNAEANFIKRCSRLPEVKSVFRIGEIKCPGLSDIDFVVILDSKCFDRPEQLLAKSFPDDIRFVMDHDPIFVHEENAVFIGTIFPIFTAIQLLGKIPEFKFSHELPHDTKAALFSALIIRKYPDDIIWLSTQPSVRLRTFLAYLHSFVHIKHCFDLLRLPISPEINQAIELDEKIRQKFTTEGCYCMADISHGLPVSLSASVSALESLSCYWISREPVLEKVFQASNFHQYHIELLRCFDKERPTIPAKPDILIFLSSVLSSATSPLAPCSSAYSRLAEMAKSYVTTKQKVVNREIARDRSVNDYVDDSRIVTSFTSNDSIEVALASLDQIKAPSYCHFMARLNMFAIENNLSIFLNWSKVWEYPWLWFNGLNKIDWTGRTVVDIKSELSPIPWFLASLGAKVTIIEKEPDFVEQWKVVRDKLGVDVQWRIVDDETLPVDTGSVDVVTSFSVIEHQTDKNKAVAETIRILKPEGILAISFDICEPEMGMTFPAWNGSALTIAEFEDLLWFNPSFGNVQAPDWNIKDIPSFIEWHLKSAPHHNYTVGAAILTKTAFPNYNPCLRFGDGWHNVEIEANDSWRWAQKEATIEIYCRQSGTISLSFQMMSAIMNNRVIVSVGDQNLTTYPIDWSGFRAVRPLKIHLTKGRHRVKFRSTCEPAVCLPDTRLLNFTLKNASVERDNGK